MDEVLENPVQFSKGINIRELMTSGSEFHVDLEFKKSGKLLDAAAEFTPDSNDDDSDSEEASALKLIEDTADQKMLASPEYHSFEELAKKMVDCEPSGNVKILILEEGEGPLVPTDGEVTVHYAAYWEKASIPFDSTLTMSAGAPMRMRLGEGRFIPGLEIGLTTVKGPKARFLLLIQPAAAWGERGVLPRILPQPALFVIALYDVRQPHAASRFNDLPSEEQTKYEVTALTVKSLHDEAKDLFAKKKYLRAIKNYQRSISILKLSKPQNDEEETAVKNLKISAFLNLAVCYTKIEKPKHVIRTLESLDYITDVDKNCKALFYFGKANEMLGKTELAIQYYEKALKLKPKDKDIGKALDDLDKSLKESAKKEKEMWQTAFRTQKEEKIQVDDDFQNGVREIFEDLARSDEYAKFDLPSGLSQNEIDYVIKLAEEFEGLKVFEDDEGKKKKITVVKQIV